MPELPKLETMIRELVAIPSVSSTLPRWDQSNRPVVERLAQWCETLGMDVALLPVNEAGDKWNLVAKAGQGEGGLVLAGHTDTVPYDDGAWNSDPFKLSERDGKWYGLGVCDMKGFFALALAALAPALPYLRKPVTLIATADEESSMDGARRLMQAAKNYGDYVVIGEPTGMRPIRQHKGILMDAIKVEGRSGHSSQPALGRNALEAMTDVMISLRELRSSWVEQYSNPGFEIPYPTLNLGCIHGGDNPNRICKSCELQYDVRLMPGMPMETVRESIRSQLRSIAEKHEVDIQLRPLFDGVDSFQEREDSRLVRICEELTGKASGTVAFATEAPFFKQLGAETVVLGPGDIDQAHQPDEYVSLDRIPPMMKLLEELIRRLCL
ncbi:acetylornithine deacetylase [Hahella sp. HN01]|uniref:acetylornithine deacetylase n=1 Tax=Hahella sp. HN01 TaxID=2847262 RepID=UPI001C1EBD79|nr:acetylornithine deacetylase [Hahella sp. HN01]MBU6951576.1 acetylornithine deacetylase [Hahella sp. HN01]